MTLVCLEVDPDGEGGGTFARKGGLCGRKMHLTATQVAELHEVVHDVSPHGSSRLSTASHQHVRGSGSRPEVLVKTLDRLFK